MKKIFSVAVIVLLLTTSVYAERGYISVKSAHDVKTTADRLETVLKQKGMNVFIRINHAQGAEKIGQELRPTELVIFGNPKVGTPLMQCAQSVAQRRSERSHTSRRSSRRKSSGKDPAKRSRA